MQCSSTSVSRYSSVLAPGVELVGDAAARKAPEHRRPVRLEAGVAPLPERRAGRQREQVRQEVARLVEELDRAGPVGHGDVDVQPEDQQRARQLLQLFDDVLVALAGREDLVLPVRKRMRAGGRDAQPDALGALRELAADVADLVLELGDVGADLRADLDDRLVELALDLIAERGARRQQLGHVRAQLPGLGVHDLELFLDADGEGVRHQRIIVQCEARTCGSGMVSCAGTLHVRGSPPHPAASPSSRARAHPRRRRRGAAVVPPRRASRTPSASTSRRSSIARSRILRTGDWNPHIFDYPTLVIYVQAMVGDPALPVGGAPGRVGVARRLLDRRGVRGGPVRRRASIGVATVWLTYRLGAELSSRRVALLAAAQMAVRPAARPRIALHPHRRADDGAHDADRVVVGARGAAGHRPRLCLGRRRVRTRRRGQVQRRHRAGRGRGGLAAPRAVVARPAAEAGRHRRRGRAGVPDRRPVHGSRSAGVSRRIRRAVLALRRARRARRIPPGSCT